MGGGGHGRGRALGEEAQLCVGLAHDGEADLVGADETAAVGEHEDGEVARGRRRGRDQLERVGEFEVREDEARGGEQAGMYEAVAGGEGGSWGGHFAGGGVGCGGERRAGLHAIYRRGGYRRHVQAIGSSDGP